MLIVFRLPSSAGSSATNGWNPVTPSLLNALMAENRPAPPAGSETWRKAVDAHWTWWWGDDNDDDEGPLYWYKG